MSAFFCADDTVFGDNRAAISNNPDHAFEDLADSRRECSKR